MKKAHNKSAEIATTGRVKWWDPDKGFGFITSDDGVDVFFHRQSLSTSTDNPIERQPVKLICRSCDVI